MGGGKGSPSAPPPIDPGKSMGEYLFGEEFATQYQGITDPRLQERLLGAESVYRPQYTALELADIGVMAEGLSGGKEGRRYKELEVELAGLEAGAGGVPSEEAMKIARASAGPPPMEYYTETRTNYWKGPSSFQVKNEDYAKQKKAYDAEVQRIAESLGGNRKAQIASVKAEMAQLEKMPGQKGLFDLLEEQSRRAGALQREELQLQRESDVGALREFAPQVVKAYRAADPYSTKLSDLASRRAQKDLGLGAKGQELLASELEAAGKAERKLLKTGASLANLTRTEQEALLKKRGMEFAESTGQLSPLEQRRVAQQARAASLARGRAMDQSGLYSEMQARMSEELGKREREIALGSQLLGQEAGLRAQRMGLGAGILSSSESMAAQRRAELLQKQQLGAGLIGQEASIGSQRLGQAFGMQRQMAGDIGSVLLGRPSAAIGLGGQVLGQAQAGAAGPMGPQLFDPNVGINMALQQRGQDVTFQGMQAQAQAAGQAGMMGAIGSIGAAAAPAAITAI